MFTMSKLTVTSGQPPIDERFATASSGRGLNAVHASVHSEKIWNSGVPVPSQLAKRSQTKPPDVMSTRYSPHRPASSEIEQSMTWLSPGVTSASGPPHVAGSSPHSIPPLPLVSYLRNDGQPSSSPHRTWPGPALSTWSNAG